MISVALFNNKGGVGKTTLAYHLAHMLQRQGARVLAVDLDPQSNLTAAILDEDELEELWDKGSELFAQADCPEQRKLFTGTEGQRTIADAVRPILEGTGDIAPVSPVTVTSGLWLLPGNLELSKFEDRLSASTHRPATRSSGRSPRRSWTVSACPRRATRPSGSRP